MAEIKIDEQALRRAVQPQIDQIEKQLNEVLQDTIREVHDEMNGQPADQVYETLVARLGQRVDGLEINEENLREVAQAIEDGTLTD